jgi:hypothetical protein
MNANQGRAATGNQARLNAAQNRQQTATDRARLRSGQAQPRSGEAQARTIERDQNNQTTGQFDRDNRFDNRDAFDNRDNVGNGANFDNRADNRQPASEAQSPNDVRNEMARRTAAQQERRNTAIQNRRNRGINNDQFGADADRDSSRTGAQRTRTNTANDLVRVDRDGDGRVDPDDRFVDQFNNDLNDGIARTFDDRFDNRDSANRTADDRLDGREDVDTMRDTARQNRQFQNRFDNRTVGNTALDQDTLQRRRLANQAAQRAITANPAARGRATPGLEQAQRRLGIDPNRPNAPTGGLTRGLDLSPPGSGSSVNPFDTPRTADQSDRTRYDRDPQSGLPVGSRRTGFRGFDRTADRATDQLDENQQRLLQQSRLQSQTGRANSGFGGNSLDRAQQQVTRQRLDQLGVGGTAFGGSSLDRAQQTRARQRLGDLDTGITGFGGSSLDRAQQERSRRQLADRIDRERAADLDRRDRDFRQPSETGFNDRMTEGLEPDNRFDQGFDPDDRFDRGFENRFDPRPDDRFDDGFRNPLNSR